MKQTNRILAFLPYIMLAVIISLFVYLHTQTYVAVKDDNLSIQIDLSPAYIIVAQEIQVSWQVEGVQGIYLNEGGVIGHDQRIINGDSCHTISFEIISEDSQTFNFSLSPIILAQPIFFLLAIIILALICVISAQFGIPILQHIGHRIIEVGNIRQVDYWEHNGLFWLRFIFIGIIISISSVYLLPTCLDRQTQPLPSISLLTLTAITSFILLSLSILKSSVLSSLAQLWRQFIPYPLTILAVFMYWGFIFDRTLFLLDMFRFPIRLLIFALGVLILFVCQNINPRSITIHIPDSKTHRWLFISSTIIIWIVIYRTQWASIVGIPFLQTILGFGLFIAPGYLLAKILIPDNPRRTRLITLGFVLSIFIAILLSTILIILALSATVFQWLFTIVGVLIWLYFLRQRQTITIPFSKVTSFTVYDILLIAFSLLSVLLLALIMRDIFLIDDDYFTYNALVTQFAKTSQFSLEDPFLGAGNLMKSRLWLMAWPVSQSLIVTFANLNILQIFHYINLILLFLVMIAISDLLRRFEVPYQFVLLSVVVTVFSILTVSFQ